MLTVLAGTPHHLVSVSPRLILGAVLVPVAYALLVLAHPLVRCPLCLGKRVVRSRPKRGKRPKVSKCPACQATGVYRMPAATAVHRFFWSIAGDHIRGSARADATERIKQEESQ